MKITIINWEKYNPKRDQKTYTWFRMDNMIYADPKIFQLTPAQKWAWVCILCLASRQNSPEIDMGNAPANYFAHVSGISPKESVQCIEMFEQFGLVSCVRQRDVVTTIPTNERTNEQTNNNAQSEIGRSCLVEKKQNWKVTDEQLDAAYQLFPRKEGKKRGFASIRRQLTKPGDFDDFQWAVRQYAEFVKINNIEKKFIKHFSTFANEWEDWLDPEMVTRLERRRM